MMNIATHTVAEGGGGGQSFANFGQICFDFAYFFLITMEKYENDKNDFLLTQGIKQLDKYSIRIKYSYLHSSTNRKLNFFAHLFTFYNMTFAV